MAVGKIAGEPLSERLAHIEYIRRTIKSPCNYFPYGGPPYFSKLSREQRRYYAYFRTILDSDEDIRGDEGYYRLLVIECLSTEEGRRRLEDYLSKDRRTGFYVFARDLLPELRIHRGADPGDGLGLQWDNMNLLYTQTFLPEYHGASEDQLSAILSSLGFGYMRRVSSRAGLDLMDKAIALVERNLIGRTGKSIGRVFAGDRVSTFRRSFAGFLPDEECSRHAIVYNTFDMYGMQTLLREIADRVEDHFIFARGSEVRPDSYYTLLTEGDLEGIMALECGGGPRRIPNGDSAISVITAGPDGRMPEDYPPPENRELYLEKKEVNRSLTDDLLAHCMPGNDGPFYPESPSLSGGMGYYRFWRDSLASGRVYPCDPVMIAMRTREMCSGKVPYADMHRELSRLARSRKGVPEELITILEELTVLSDLPVDRSEAGLSWRMLRYLLFRIMSGRRQPVGRWLFTECLEIANIDRYLSDKVSWDAFCMAFAACMREGYRKKSQWFAEHGLYTVSMRCEGGYGLPPCDFEAVTAITGIFREHTVALASEVGQVVVRGCDKRSRTKSPVLFGMDVTDIAEDAAAIASGRRTVKRAPRVDMGKVKQAREDLDYVVSAVGTETPSEEPEPEPPKEEDARDPWDVLVSSLSSDDMKYLSKCLSGTAPDIIRESAINELAAHLVGDAIIEDGRVYVEYMQDITSRLG